MSRAAIYLSWDGILARGRAHRPAHTPSGDARARPRGDRGSDHRLDRGLAACRLHVPGARDQAGDVEVDRPLGLKLPLSPPGWPLIGRSAQATILLHRGAKNIFAP